MRTADGRWLNLGEVWCRNVGCDAPLGLYGQADESLVDKKTGIVTCRKCGAQHVKVRHHYRLLTPSIKLKLLIRRILGIDADTWAGGNNA
jgi:hypothetical protein